MKNVLDETSELKKHGVSSCSDALVWVLEKTGPLKVIEIGTSYGNQIPIIAPLCSELVCVDPMYDWVPDIDHNQKIDKSKISKQKIDSWKSNVQKSGKKDIRLIVGSSYDEETYLEPALVSSDVLIIDGCHHPSESVFLDYKNFFINMRNEHYILWDDTNEQDVKDAIVKAKKFLEDNNCSYKEKSLGTCLVMYVSSRSSVE